MKEHIERDSEGELLFKGEAVIFPSSIESDLGKGIDFFRRLTLSDGYCEGPRSLLNSFPKKVLNEYNPNSLDQLVLDPILYKDTEVKILHYLEMYDEGELVFTYDESKDSYEESVAELKVLLNLLGAEF